MELSNINPRIVVAAASLALSDFDRVTEVLAKEFEDRKRAKTRRKYYLFGTKIQYTESKLWFESCYELEIALASCRREDDKDAIEILRQAACTALDTCCSLTLNQKEWKLIKNYF